VPGRGAKWLSGALTVVIALWITIGQLSLMTGPHPADAIQAWLRANLREGDEVARLWPEYPVLDARRYSLLRIDPWRPHLPAGALPNYIIMDNMALGPPAPALLDLLGRSYREVARFGAQPSLFGATMPEGETPHDWKYSHPEFIVYARR
jgi:hypothetical protein